MKKRIITLVMALVMLMLCASCTNTTTVVEEPTTTAAVEPTESTEPSTAAVNEKLKIGFSVISLQFTTYNEMKENIYAACEERGWEVITAEAGMSVEKTMNDCLDLLTQDIDALLVASWFGDSFGEVFAKAEELNVPVFMIDTGGLPGTGYVTHIGIDDFAAGRAMGDWVAGYLKKEGKAEINCIVNLTATTIGRNRVDGILAGLREHPGVTINVLQEYINDSREGFLNDMEDALITYPNIDYILGGGQMEGLGSYDACQAAKREEIYITCFTNEDEEQSLVDKGTQMIANIDILNDEMGKLAVKCVEDYYNGVELDIITKSPVILYTVEGIIPIDY